MKRIERRVLPTMIEVRAEGESKKIVGHAAVFNADSKLLYGSFIERIAPGAFRDSLKKPDDVLALINHDSNLILGRSTSGTLRLSEDADGLAVEIDPPDTSYARDLIVSMERGDVSQMSFGFQVDGEDGEKWERGKDGAPDIRTLLKVKLFDVSTVTCPAYPDTDVAMRSHEAFVTKSATVESIEHRKRRNELEAVA